jgi:hypothetical protein
MQVSVFRISLLTGIATGIATLLVTLLLYTLSANPFGQHRLLYLPVYGIGIMAAILWYRSKNEGFIKTLQSIGLGLMVNLVAAIVYGLLLWISLSTFGQGLLELHQADLSEWMLRHKDILLEQMEAEQYNSNLEAVKSITPRSLSIGEWRKVFGIGFGLGAIIGVFLKKSPSPNIGNS